MMDTLRKIAGPDINLQTLSRGISVVGLSQCPRDIINLHAVLFKKHGTTTIRNFDALNDMQNLDYSGRCITNAGLHHQITISLMGLPPGIKDTTVHTADFYIEKLHDILERNIPFDSISFKDASGTTPPQIVKETIKKTREILGKDRIIWFHTHDTAGLGTACIMAACEAGVDGIDLSKSPVSGGTCQPDILTVWSAFRGTEFTLDVDYQKILKAERVFEDCMEKYLLPPEAKETTPLIVLAPMPGGALTANTMMMRDTNTLHLYPKVIEEMAEVVARGGYGTSVTPVSQFYIQQAYMNVVQGKWKKITEGYGNMVLGYFGKTPRPADPEIIKLASEQLKKEPFTAENPLDIIPPGIEKATKILQENKLPVTDENIFIIAACEGKGLDFLKGNSPLSVYYKEEKKKEEPKESVNKEQKVVVAPTLTTQNLTVTVNGKDYNVTVKPTGQETTAPTQKAVTPPPSPQPTKKEEPKPTPKPTPIPTGAKTVKAPLHGIVLKIFVKEGDKVKEDQAVAVLEAMKMENEIYTEKAGVITQILVREGESISEGKDMMVIE
jgi:pyruvate carboxylase subunit B